MGRPAKYPPEFSVGPSSLCSVGSSVPVGAWVDERHQICITRWSRARPAGLTHPCHQRKDVGSKADGAVSFAAGKGAVS